MKRLMLSLALICFLPAVSHAATSNEQRQSIKEMSKDTLDRLYKAEPGTKQDINNAVGYAVFTSADIAAIFVSGGFGHGVAHDNKSGRDTFMKMASAGVGLGIGAKDINTIFVFNNPDSFHDFVTTGLDLSGHADVAIKENEKGGAAGGAEDVLPGVRIYQLTDSGLQAQLMLKGTKYWQDAELNDISPRTEATDPYRRVNR